MCSVVWQGADAGGGDAPSGRAPLHADKATLRVETKTEETVGGVPTPSRKLGTERRGRGVQASVAEMVGRRTFGWVFDGLRESDGDVVGCKVFFKKLAPADRFEQVSDSDGAVGVRGHLVKTRRQFVAERGETEHGETQ